MKTETNKSLEITNQENIKNINKTNHELNSAAYKENLACPAGRTLTCNSEDMESSEEKFLIPPDPKKKKQPSHKETQTVSIHCDLSDLPFVEPHPDYWKDTAEKRRLVLAEALDKNKELWTKVEQMEMLDEENSSLKEKCANLENKLVDVNDLIELLQEMLDQKEQEEKPPNNDDSLLN